MVFEKPIIWTENKTEIMQNILKKSIKFLEVFSYVQLHVQMQVFESLWQ
jgi:hypothetical protein